MIKAFATLIMLLSFSSFSYAEKITLALNWKAEPEFGGFYAADLLGYFKEQGLDVKIQEGGSGTPTVQMLANSKVDFAIVSADEIILSQDRGGKNKVKALFSVYQTSPYIVMAHKERGFKSLKDVFQNDGILSLQSGLPYYQYLVKKFGKPKVKVVPYAGGVGSFVNDKNFSQQGFITIEPLLAEKAGAKAQSFLIADVGFNPYLVVLATTDAVLKNKPDVTKKILTAVKKGWDAYLKDPTATNKHMSSLNKSLDLETFNKGADIQKPLILVDKTEPGSMTTVRWQTLADQLQDLGLIKKKQNPQDYFIQ